MKSIFLKIDSKLFAETEKLAKMSGVDMSAYINEALRFYHSNNARVILENKLSKESMLVRANSLEVLREMELMAN